MAFDYATLSDVRTAEVMSGEIVRLLAARSGDSLLRHPALLYAGNNSGSGSSVVTVGHYGLDGYDIMGTVSDGGTVSATDLTDGSTSITLVRKSLRYTPTDLARLTDPHGVINPARFAQSMVVSASETLVDLVANLGGGFSNAVGSSGVDATVTDFLNAKGQLENNDVPGPYAAVLHPQQWTDITNDMNTSSGGAIAFNPVAPELIRVVGNGYKGEFAGVQVFTSTRVPASGGNRQGFMFGRSAIMWADGSAPIVDPSRQVMIRNILFEIERNAAAGTTEFVGHYYVGVSEGIDAAGVGIITDQ